MAITFTGRAASPPGVRFSTARRSAPLAIAVAAALIVHLGTRCLASTREGSPPVPAEAMPATGATAADFETKFFDLLSSGKQSEAEELVTAEVERYPKAATLVGLLKRNQDKQAQEFKLRNFVELRPAQRPLFLLAACARSRFDKETAFPIFNAVWMLDHRTPSAKCSYCVLWLDSTQIHVGPKQEQDKAIRVLTRLADANPSDQMIRWMLAVECRTWDRDEEGVAAYKIILDHWKPGPALVHQTYANLLDNLKRYDGALVARYQVVQMEPAGWSYDGLANTLHGLERYDEACAAHAIATRINPRSSMYWSKWAVALNGQQKYDDAIAKCERALELAPTNGRAYWMWGVALDGQGKTRDALEKCKIAKVVLPESPKLDELISDLEKRLHTSTSKEPSSTLTKGE